MVVAIPPVMEAHADLQDAVVEPADRTTRVAPERLEDLVLLEELSLIEQVDPVDERLGCRLGTTRARILVDLAAGYALGRPGGLALAASGLGRAQP